MVENAPPSAGEVRALAHQLLSWADQLARARQMSRALADADRHELVQALAASARELTRLRARAFPDLAFADAAWQVLLEVFTSEADGVRVSPEHLAAELKLPLPTIQQGVSQLIDKRVLERSSGVSGVHDGRLKLTLSGWQKMTELFLASADHVRPRSILDDAPLLAQ